MKVNDNVGVCPMEFMVDYSDSQSPNNQRRVKSKLLAKITNKTCLEDFDLAPVSETFSSK